MTVDVRGPGSRSSLRENDLALSSRSLDDGERDEQWQRRDILHTAS